MTNLERDAMNAGKKIMDFECKKDVYVYHYPMELEEVASKHCEIVAIELDRYFSVNNIEFDEVPIKYCCEQIDDISYQKYSYEDKAILLVKVESRKTIFQIEIIKAWEMEE